MNILIPVNNSDIENSLISQIDNAKFWALIDLQEGKIKSSDFYQTKEEITDFIDVVIVESDKEYVWPFMEENIAVLVAPMQKSIDDIIEAFLFKELHDFSV